MLVAVVLIIVWLGVFGGIGKKVLNDFKKKKEEIRRSQFKREIKRSIIDHLKEWGSVDNRYCENCIVVVGMEVAEKFPEEVKKYDVPVYNLCCALVLQGLNYKADLYDDKVERELLSEHPSLIRVIEEIVNERITAVAITEKDSEGFYRANPDAWEIRFYHLQESFTPANVEEFYKDVCTLAKWNSSRITIRRKIYLNSHHFLIDKEKAYSLRFYLRYINVKGATENYPYQKINKKNRKILFKNRQEEVEFDAICEKLKADGNLRAAVRRLNALGISQRKEIKLDIEAIKRAAQKQSEVAGILGKLLLDEENEPEVVQVSSSNHKEALMQLFIEHSLRVNKKEVDIFASARGIFVGQLIESINEEYYEELDDVLIEEEDDMYVMDNGYYQQIQKHGD